MLSSYKSLSLQSLHSLCIVTCPYGIVSKFNLTRVLMFARILLNVRYLFQTSIWSRPTIVQFRVGAFVSTATKTVISWLRSMRLIKNKSLSSLFFFFP